MNKAAQKRLNYGFGLSLLLLVVSAAASIYTLSLLNYNTDEVRQRYRKITQLKDVANDINDAIITQHGYTLTGYSGFTTGYPKVKHHLDSTIKVLDGNKELASDPLYAEVKALKKEKIDAIDAILLSREQGKAISYDTIIQTRRITEQLKEAINRLTAKQVKLLQAEQDEVRLYRTFAPVVTIIALLLAIGVTLYLVRTLVAQIKERGRLQAQLNAQNAVIEKRITSIKNVADQISAGNYDYVLDQDNTGDELSSIAKNLARMGTALKEQFAESTRQQWLQTALAQINSQMVGDKAMDVFMQHLLDSLVNLTASNAGAIYTCIDDGIKLIATYAVAMESMPQSVAPGEGLAGQAVKEARMLTAGGDGSLLNVATLVGNIKPAQVLAYPLQHNGQCVALVELAAPQAFTPLHLSLLQQSEAAIALGVLAARNKRKLQTLLEQTREQRNQLVESQSQLENMNAELEAQAQKLQASEEELRVQQEELLQSNQELEERSALLEEKNTIIVERNSEIQRKATELEQSTRYKSEFLANMSHELRTPLNSILLLSKLMADSAELDKEYVSYAEVIQSSGQGLLALIDEILDLSKIEAGKMTITLEDVAFAEIMRDLTGLFKPLTNDKKLELNTSISPALPERLKTDKMRLEQVLKNLLSNALKFTQTGSLNITFAPAEQEGYVALSVRDSGIGIPKNKQALVFEAFQQADGSTVRKYGGTGLGLSISKELTKLLGGSLTLESEEGKGSTFTVLIPLAGPPAHPVDNIPAVDHFKTEMPAPVLMQETAGAAGGTAIAKPRVPERLVPDDRDNLKPGDKVILIIEDDLSFAPILQKYTHDRGYKCLVATRGDDGVTMAQQYMPHAILLDIQLPGMDGWEVMNELKANSATRRIPVHMMSSLEARKESITRGAVDFISKPFALDAMPQIFSKLEQALSAAPKKVLIIEENQQHAQALSYFLNSYNIQTRALSTVADSISKLQGDDVNCVILDMGVPGSAAYDALEAIKTTPGLEELPVIIFTGKSLSNNEQTRIRQYADSIVVKTAHSYERIVDEVGIFLHLVEDQVKPAAASAKNSGLDTMQHILAGKKVLIAEDDVRNIFSLTKALEAQKMQVIVAENGREALDLLAANTDVDIILMDMMMPEMDGYDTIRNIRKQPGYSNLPILAVTAKTSVGDREKCIEAGASDYISKPVDVYQLISLLKVWLYNAPKK